MTKHEFELQFRKLYVPLGMYALRVLGDVAEAEDVVQDSFVNVWSLVADGMDVSNFKAYMYRSVRNEALRRLRLRLSSSQMLDIDLCADVPDELIDTSDRDARLWLAINSLPARCREIFLMSKRDGMSNREIADELDISVKTVENQMTKAYRELRGTLSLRSGKVFFLPFL